MNKTTITSLGLSILATVIAVVTWNHVHFVPAPSAQNVGNVVQQDLYQYPYGFTVGPGNTYEQIVPLVIPIGSNQAGICNNTGYNWYIRNYVGELVGTSSKAVSGGSFNMYVGTSTTATTADATTTMSNYTLIDGSKTFIATSTPVTSIVFNSDVQGGANGQGVVNVPNGVCINSALEASTSIGSIAATSTSRGFSVNGFIEYTSQGNQ